MGKNLCLIMLVLAITLTPLSLDLGALLSQAQTTITYRIISEDTVWDLAGSPYVIFYDDIKVNAGVTLTIEPGVVVKLDRKGFLVRGTLDIRGSEEAPVIITSLHNDDQSGQNVSWSRGQPAPGDWGAIQSLDNGRVLIDRATISYGGVIGIARMVQRRPLTPNRAMAYSYEGAAIGSFGGEIIITNSEISRNIIGLEAEIGGALTIRDSAIFDNVQGGLLNNSGSLVVADHNWWGHGSGPYHAELNPDGQGDSVVGPALIEPWVGQTAPDPPVLEYSSADGYGDDESSPGVEPNAGAPDNIDFIFKVVYRDDNDRAPDSLILAIENEEIAFCHEMHPDPDAPEYLRDGDHGNGEQFVYKTKMPQGEYGYYFLADSGNVQVRLPAEGNLVFRSGLSNIVFIPGIKASRLYRPGTIFENQLWEPNRQADVEKLFLDEEGQSLDPQVYTDDAIDEINLINPFGLGANIYKSFLQDLQKMEEDGLVERTEVFPYDWRQGIDEIVARPVRTRDGNYSMISKLIELADDSRSGQVTIVAHSMGGLVAKELIRRLDNMGQSGLVDKLILVASPQSGTPDAIAALLHGDGQDLPKGFGVLLDRPSARSFGHNMQSAYSLLPARQFFDSAPGPVIVFDPNSSFWSPFGTRYGDAINDYDILSAFLTGQDWRLPPDYYDIDSPAILSDAKLASAQSLHSRWSNWTPPPGMKVIQIAGWGLDTVSGIRYKDRRILVCPNNNYDNMSACHYESRATREPILSIAGDQTVLTSSAEMMEGAETYYLDLDSSNYGIANKDRNHADILEIDSIRQLINNIVSEVSLELPVNIYNDLNELVTRNPRLRISVHSPVTLGMYDPQNLHTGLMGDSVLNSDLRYIEENAPDSYYMEFGESKYIGASNDYEKRIEINGTGYGVFLLEISEVSGNTGEIINTIFFRDVPVTPETKADLLITDLMNYGQLEVDIDGDGQIDLRLDPSNSACELTSWIKEMREIIVSSDAERIVKFVLLAELRIAERLLEKGSMSSIVYIIKLFEKHISIIPEKYLDSETAESILKITGLINKSCFN